MKTIVEHAQGLVYSLLCLMPSTYQKASPTMKPLKTSEASFVGSVLHNKLVGLNASLVLSSFIPRLNALLGLFLEAQGQPLPQHTQVKSASSLSRFLNHYGWSTRGMIRRTRQSVLQQIAQYRPHRGIPLKVLIDLTSLPKCGKFSHLGTATAEPKTPDPWVRMLNGKRGLHIVVLYLVVGEWRVPWSFRVWRGKGYPSPSQLACKLLATVPSALSRDAPVIVLADTEFGTVAFLEAVRKRSWRALVGMRCTRKMQDGRQPQTALSSGSARTASVLRGHFLSCNRVLQRSRSKRADRHL